MNSRPLGRVREGLTIRCFFTANGGLFVFAAFQPAIRQARMGVAGNIREHALEISPDTHGRIGRSPEKPQIFLCLLVIAYSWNMETHTTNDAYTKRNPTAIILTEMALILVSGLEMTVSRCEIIISRFAITISHLEINFTMPSGINPHTATRIPHNSATNPRTASRLGVITPMPLPCPTAISMAVNWLSLPPAPPTTPTNLANPCGEGENMAAATIKSGTNTINRAPTALIMYII